MDCSLQILTKHENVGRVVVQNHGTAPRNFVSCGKQQLDATTDPIVTKNVNCVLTAELTVK